MVGRFSAGSTSSTAARSFLWTLSISPTLPSALMAPSSSMRMSSSFRRFRSSCHDCLFAINCVFDSITVSMIVSLLARSDDPVSVTSTMASASTGGFTSVAPQLNSTLAVTPCDARYRFVVATSSVAMIFPSRSFTERKLDASGTASTHRTLPKLCLA